MFANTQSIIINRNRKYVYTVAETYPKFATFYQIRETISQSDDEMIVKVGSTLFGFPTSWIGQGKKTKFESIEFIQIEGILKGLIACWKFEETGLSTKVTISSKFILSIPLFGKLLEWIIGTFKVKKTVKLILEALKKEAESTI